MRPSSPRGTDDVTPAPSRLDRAPTRIVSSRTSLAQHLRDIWTYRELLRGLVRKELQVKYKNSVVGVGWSMVNPAMTLAVFYFVFQIVLKNGIPGFAVYLLCGLLVWYLFSTALPSATGEVVGNAAIVKKVAFPREILALASVGASLQFFFYQAIVMVLALVVFRFVPSFSYLPLLLPALLALLMFTAALGVFLAAMNVYFRDIQHLLEVVMTAWFWATPIVYTYRNIADRLGRHAWVFRLNPITPIVLTFQRALYNKISPRSTTGSGLAPILPAHVG
ncbi:MAG TPA: ABC transporter permease, partial [Acidimicrobiales bacterium]|nr:ABC transporter permease [Acidimicrobiales bacterium]